MVVFGTVYIQRPRKPSKLAGDVFGALCTGAALLAPRRAAVLGALQALLVLRDAVSGDLHANS